MEEEQQVGFDNIVKEEKMVNQDNNHETFNENSLSNDQNYKDIKLQLATQSTVQRKIDNQYQELIRLEIACSHCTLPIIFPTQSECGHSYCLPCLEHIDSIQSVCHLCGHKASKDQKLVVKETSHKFVINFIEKYLSCSEKEAYYQRLNRFEDQEKMRKLTQKISVFSYVDFRESRKKSWKVGMIKQINYVRRQVTSYWIVPLHEQNSLIEIQQSSRNIAAFKYYTADKQKSKEQAQCKSDKKSQDIEQISSLNNDLSKMVLQEDSGSNPGILTQISPNSHIT